MNYKGHTFFDIGYIYTPYIPMIHSLHQSIALRAYDLWRQAVSNNEAEQPAEYYWDIAQKELANPIAMSIVAELPNIVFVPGSTFNYPITYKNLNTGHVFAFATIDDHNALYVVAQCVCDRDSFVRRFDLYSEEDLESAIQHLQHLSTLPPATNPCGEIPLDSTSDENVTLVGNNKTWQSAIKRGLITRLGKNC